MSYDYDAEIEQLVGLPFDRLFGEWENSGGPRHDAGLGGGARLFALCGQSRVCGCPTMIRGRWLLGRAETPSLKRQIMGMKDIPTDFGHLRDAWESSDAAGRRKLLEPFKRAQVMTDEVLEKECAK